MRCTCEERKRGMELGSGSRTRLIKPIYGHYSVRLSNLRAVRWVGPTIPQQGFDKPQLAISFTTSPDDKSPHRLLVGKRAGDGTWFAHVDEREDTLSSNDSILTCSDCPRDRAWEPSSSAAGAKASPIPQQAELFTSRDSKVEWVIVLNRLDSTPVPGRLFR